MSVSGFSTLSKISQLIPTHLPPPPDYLPILSEKYFFVSLRTLRYAFYLTPCRGVRGNVESLLNNVVLWQKLNRAELAHSSVAV